MTTAVLATINVLSTQFLKVAVRATRASRPIVLGQDRVQFQIVAPNATITDNNWLDATWEHSGNNSNYLATLLIGPSGAVTFPVGVYDVWVKVIDDPEIAILKSGQFEVVAAD